MNKLRQFCFLILITAAAMVILSFPYSFQNRLSSISQGRGYFDESTPKQIPLTKLKEIASSSPAGAWRETGATVLPVAAQIMTMRNPQGVALDEVQKGYLRPLFGDLVDRVTIVYQAKLLDRWSQGGKETQIGQVNSSAQTYCNRIYIRESYRPHSTRDLILMAHEMTHAQQCDRAGGIGNFGASYFQGYYQGGETYEDNPLEKSARAIEKKFALQLCNKIDCPPRKGRYYTNYKGWKIDLPANL